MTPPVQGRLAAATHHWRVLPWDPTAPEGERFSVRYVPPSGSQTGGRFDLGDVPVLYLAETPEHAVAELLRREVGKPLKRGHLRIHDERRPGTYHPRALVSAVLSEPVARALPDLGDGAALARLGVRADALASEDRRLTQAISRSIHEAGLPGFRWWSALRGDWHATVLFLDRVPSSSVEYGNPEPLALTHPVVLRVARMLRMEP